MLSAAYWFGEPFAALTAELRSHRLHRLLLTDPVIHRAWTKPRGYAGDPETLDLICDHAIPPGTPALAAAMLEATRRTVASAALRHRRERLAERLEAVWRAGGRVCVLACGHLREADALAGEDLGSLVAVDHDLRSIERVYQRFGASPQLIEAKVVRFLRQARREGRTFDLICASGLAERCTDRELVLLQRLMRDCLAPRGEIVLADFAPDHDSAGWMEAVMDWRPVYRSDHVMHRLAACADLRSRSQRDPTATIAFHHLSA